MVNGTNPPTAKVARAVADSSARERVAEVRAVGSISERAAPGAGPLGLEDQSADLIVKELTTQGAMEPARLFESPYTDVAATGPDGLFAEGDVGKIVDILGAVRSTAVVAATG